MLQKSTSSQLLFLLLLISQSLWNRTIIIVAVLPKPPPQLRVLVPAVPPATSDETLFLEALKGAREQRAVIDSVCPGGTRWLSNTAAFTTYTLPQTIMISVHVSLRSEVKKTGTPVKESNLAIFASKSGDARKLESFERLDLRNIEPDQYHGQTTNNTSANNLFFKMANTQPEANEMLRKLRSCFLYIVRWRGRQVWSALLGRPLRRYLDPVVSDRDGPNHAVIALNYRIEYSPVFLEYFGDMGGKEE